MCSISQLGAEFQKSDANNDLQRESCQVQTAVQTKKVQRILSEELEGNEIGNGHVFSMAFSPDGETLAAADQEGRIRLWNVKTAKVTHLLEGHGELVPAIAFSPDGKLLASCSHDKAIKLWDVKTGESKRTLTGHKGPVSTIAFSPDGKVLASGGGSFGKDDKVAGEVLL